MATRSPRSRAASRRRTAASIPARRKGSWSWSSDGSRKPPAPARSVMPRRASSAASHDGNPQLSRSAAAAGTRGGTPWGPSGPPRSISSSPVDGAEGAESLVAARQQLAGREALELAERLGDRLPDAPAGDLGIGVSAAERLGDDRVDDAAGEKGGSGQGDGRPGRGPARVVP